MAALIDVLAVGLADAPSGSFVVYEYNSTTLADVYSDYAATKKISTTADFTLSSAGRKVCYVKNTVDVTVKTAAGVTLTTFTAGARAEMVEVVNTALTGLLSTGSQGAGGATTLNAMVTSALSTFGGVDLKFLEATGGNARLLKDVLAERFLSVKDVKGAGAEVAVGGGATDDYVAIQAAMDRMVTRGGGLVLFPKGTFNCSTGLTVSNAGIWLVGVGPTATILKNTGAAITLLTVDVTGESNMVISGLSLTHSTTSSGTALTVTAGDGLVVRDCTAALHRKGFAWAATALRGELDHCRVASTDGNAAGIAVTLGKDGRASHCIAAAATGKAFSLAGQYAHAEFCRVLVASATGFGYDAADTSTMKCHAGACTTGFSVGAFARCGPLLCTVGANTTDMLTNAAATSVVDLGNTFTTRTFNEYAGQSWLMPRQRVIKLSRSTFAGTDTWTPDPRLGELQVAVVTSGLAVTLTVAATATTDLQDGQTMYMVIEKDGLNTLSLVFNAQYITPLSSVGGSNAASVFFRWRAGTSKWISVFHLGQSAVNIPAN